jgi:hypothetical protein
MNGKKSYTKTDGKTSQSSLGEQSFSAGKIDLATTKEIEQLIESDDFPAFIATVQESIGDGITYDEMLSNARVLFEALKLVKRSQ